MPGTAKEQYLLVDDLETILHRQNAEIDWITAGPVGTIEKVHSCGP